MISLEVTMMNWRVCVLLLLHFISLVMNLELQKRKSSIMASRPFSGKFKPNRIMEDDYEEVNTDKVEVDRSKMHKMIEEKENEKVQKVNELEHYLKQMEKLDPDIDKLVNNSFSREELERQVLDHDYMRERHEESKMSESMYSASSEVESKPMSTALQPVKAVKPSIYKPPMPGSSK
jgi:hypothetical protein